MHLDPLCKDFKKYQNSNFKKIFIFKKFLGYVTTKTFSITGKDHE